MECCSVHSKNRIYVLKEHLYYQLCIRLFYYSNKKMHTLVDRSPWLLENLDLACISNNYTNWISDYIVQCYLCVLEARSSKSLSPSLHTFTTIFLYIIIYLCFKYFFLTSKTVFVYCSETTENLLMCNPSYSHLREYIVSGFFFKLFLHMYMTFLWYHCILF